VGRAALLAALFVQWGFQVSAGPIRVAPAKIPSDPRIRSDLTRRGYPCFMEETDEPRT